MINAGALTVTQQRVSLCVMHLVWFHRVLIAAAILFFFGFGVWELFAYRSDRNANTLIFGIVSLLVAVALIIYLYRLKRILKIPE
jgi:hypothetical protein